MEASVLNVAEPLEKIYVAESICPFCNAKAKHCSNGPI